MGEDSGFESGPTAKRVLYKWKREACDLVRFRVRKAQLAIAGFDDKRGILATELWQPLQAGWGKEIESSLEFLEGM